MISVVVPCFRGEHSLDLLVEKLLGTIGTDLAEIVLVFDGGTTVCWETIERLKASHDCVTAVKLQRNFGQHNAIICGFDYCNGDLVVTMDEDLQHDPADIPKLVRKLTDEQLDVVYGKYRTRNHNLFRNLSSGLLNRLLRIGIPDLHHDYTAFRVIRTSLAKELIKMNNSYTFLDGYLSWVTTNIDSLEVEHHQGLSESSAYSTSKLIAHMLNIFFTFSTLPIRLISYGGLILFVLTSAYTIFVITFALLQPDYFLMGYPSLIAILGFGFSFTLYGMGVLGEYLQRINMKTTKRPNYLVAKELVRKDG